jgi:hypothetical protein
MKSILIPGLALAACVSMPAIVLAQDSAAKPVRHHHVYRRAPPTEGTSGVNPYATAQIPQVPGLTESPHVARFPNGEGGRPSAEWDCTSGTAGCSWEPYGWRTRD